MRSLSSASAASPPTLPSATGSPVATVSERVELLKWLGVALMLLDHGKYLGLVAPEWIGRGALPLFALAFGYALNVVPDTRALLVRLLYAGVCAEALGAWALTGSDLNVLFLFALCTWLAHARRSCTPTGYFVRVALAFAFSPLVEYSAGGLLLVLAAQWFMDRRSLSSAAAVVAASLVLVVPNDSLWATLWVIFGMAMLAAPLGLPRVRRAFYVVYVAQWPILWVLS